MVVYKNSLRRNRVGSRSHIGLILTFSKGREFLIQIGQTVESQSMDKYDQDWWNFSGLLYQEKRLVTLQGQSISFHTLYTDVAMSFCSDKLWMQKSILPIQLMMLPMILKVPYSVPSIWQAACSVCH